MTVPTPDSLSAPLPVRLREYADAPMYALIRRQLRETADEIERLGRELAASNAALLQRQDKFCTVEADSDRLRVELERIYRIARDWRHLSDMRGRVCGIAEAALEAAPAAQRPESETGAEPLSDVASRTLCQHSHVVAIAGTQCMACEKVWVSTRREIPAGLSVKPNPAPAAAVQVAAAPSPEGAEAATAGAASLPCDHCGRPVAEHLGVEMRCPVMLSYCAAERRS